MSRVESVSMRKALKELLPASVWAQEWLYDRDDVQFRSTGVLAHYIPTAGTWYVDFGDATGNGRYLDFPQDVSPEKIAAAILLLY